MDSIDPEFEHPKKRRRREVQPKPCNARLQFDDGLHGDAAVLSSHLWKLLGLRESTVEGDAGQELHIAISPSFPLHLNLQDSAWTIIPLRKQLANDNAAPTEQVASIKISPRALSCQAFNRTLASVDPIRYGSHLPKSVEVRVLPTKPLHLETVYVSVERGLLEKVDEIQQKFGGGFHHVPKSKRLATQQQQQQQQQQIIHQSTSDAAKLDLPLEDRLTAVVREGLSTLDVLHMGDVFPLPLPSHPITHAKPAPAIMLACEPVSQGQISPNTKIVLVQTGSIQEKTIKKLTPAPPIVEESLEDTAEDTANDAFFSAAEDRPPTTASETDEETEDEVMTEESELEHSEEESDSMDDLITLSAPGLPPQPAGTLSGMTAATPRPGGARMSGIQTPGSVYSNFTATTAKAGNRPGKVFRTEALLRKIPGELLHPRPAPDEDDESTIFVDTSTLAKIGCFSGDWVRIEVARNISPFGFSASALTALGGFNNDEEDSDWRAVRIYGLSGLLNQKPRYSVDKTGDRRSSFSQNQPPPSLTPVLYLSPILLSNLSNAHFVKVGALPKAPRHGRPSSISRPPIPKAPPLAREVTLLMVSTPLTMDRKLETSLFSLLGAHFEKKHRIVKRGDLVGVPIDTELGKATGPSVPSEGVPEHDDVSIQLSRPEKANRHGLATAWFYVQYVDADIPFDRDENPENHNWGDIAIVDVAQTRLAQSAKTIRSIPDAIEEWTKYWLGTKTVPSRPGRAYDLVVTAADLPVLEKLPLEKRIAGLVAASTSPRATSLGLPPVVILLHSNQRQIGKSFTATSACSSVGLHTFTISCHDLLSEHASTTGGGDVKTETLLQARAERALACGAHQTALLLQHIDALTADRLVQVLEDVISTSRVLIATTTKLDDVHAGIRNLFTHEFEVSAPDEHARELILRNASLSTFLPLSPAINLKNLALQTAALVAGDLLDVVNRASLARSRRLLSLAETQSCKVSDILVSGGLFTTQLVPADFSTAISAARSTFSDAIGAPKIPTVTWADVGGLSNQKDAIMETISLPLTRPELFANGVRKRSGILFYGPPGTGKTLLAKAIATEFSLNFFSVKGPELLNMYIGESEANVRRVFQKARDARPCVVFFDELDSVAPKRGNQGDSGGVMDRIVSQLLAELDGMSGGGSGGDSGGSSDAVGGQSNGGGGVFVIGATNRPDLLDPALLRPGRFDKMLYLGVADSHTSQTTILEALTRKFILDPSVDLKKVADRLPFTYTGADLYALCSDAMLKAITRKTKAVDETVARLSRERGEEISTNWFFDHLATRDDIEVVVNEEDFAQAQQELVGSVSAKELEHFERIRKLFEDQDISAASGTGGSGKISQVSGGKKVQPPQPPLVTIPSPTSALDEITPVATAARLPIRDLRGIAPTTSMTGGRIKRQTSMPGFTDMSYDSVDEDDDDHQRIYPREEDQQRRQQNKATGSIGYDPHRFNYDPDGDHGIGSIQNDYGVSTSEESSGGGERGSRSINGASTSASDSYTNGTNPNTGTDSSP